MESPDHTAERHPAHETYRLVDYRPVALPVLVLRLDVVILLRRQLSIPTEYALRATVATGGSAADVEGLLGLSPSYAAMLMRDMEREQLIQRAEGGHVEVLPKGDSILADQQQSETRECEVTALWDMGSRSIISGYVEDLITSRDAATLGYVRLLPKSTRAPREEDIDVKALHDAWKASRGKGSDDDELIKILKVRGGRLRVRPATALAYASEDRKDVRVQVVVNDTISDEASQNFGRFGWADQLSLNVIRGQRTSERALRARVFGEEGGGPSGSGHLQIIQRRAVVLFQLTNARSAQEAARTEEREGKISRLVDELRDLDQRLLSGGACEILPFELASAFEKALRDAAQSIVVTTTLPIRRRLTEATLRAMERALKSGISIRLLISDRIKRDSDEGLPAHLKRLNDLAAREPSLDVGFLADANRSFFEMLVDDSVLLVANDPPLGERRDPEKFRSFAGLRVTSATLVQDYKSRYLTQESTKVIQRFVSERGGHEGKGAKSIAPQTGKGARAVKLSGTS